MPRAWPTATSSFVEMEERSRDTGIPLAFDAASSVAWDLMISPTVRGFVARLWICPPPSGAKGWPR